jgi:hypothetical protein
MQALLQEVYFGKFLNRLGLADNLSNDLFRKSLPYA